MTFYNHFAKKVPKVEKVLMNCASETILLVWSLNFLVHVPFL